MPRPIQRVDEALGLSRHYNLKGKLPLQLDEIVVPVHIVGELEFSGTPGVAYRATPAAGAGQRSSVGLVNPAGSGVLAVVRRIGVAQTDSFLGQLTPSSTPLVPSGSSTGFPRDNRLERPMTLSIQSAVTTGFPPVNGPVDAFLGLPVEKHETWILPPGSSLWVIALTDNAAVDATFAWEESAVLPSEG